MNDLLIIWIKSNIVFTLLIVFFALVLRRETLHYFKRLYLLCIPIIAFAFPFIRFKTSNETLSSVSKNFSFVQQPLNVVSTEQTNHFDYETLVYLAFGFVSIIFFGLTIKGLVTIFSIIHNSTKEKLDIGVLCNADQKINPFSFFNYIVLNKQSHGDSDLQKIIKHEQVHVYQRHFVDMLLAQLSIILCWLNPAVWMYRHYITENLEFIVDHEVLQSGVNKKHYQYSILSTSVYDSSLVFANHFNHSLIKNRISMMNKNLSNPRNMWKAIFALPLLFVLIIFSGQINTVVANTLSETLTTIKKEKQTRYFVNYDEVTYKEYLLIGKSTGFYITYSITDNSSNTDLKFGFNKHIEDFTQQELDKAKNIDTEFEIPEPSSKNDNFTLQFIETDSINIDNKILKLNEYKLDEDDLIWLKRKDTQYFFNKKRVNRDEFLTKKKDIKNSLQYVSNEAPYLVKFYDSSKFKAKEALKDFRTEIRKFEEDTNAKTKKTSKTVLRLSSPPTSGPNAEGVYPKIDFETLTNEVKKNSNASPPHVAPGFKFKNEHAEIKFYKKGNQYEVLFKNPLVLQAKASSKSPKLFFLIDNQLVSALKFTAFDYESNKKNIQSTGAGTYLDGVAVHIITKKELLGQPTPLDVLYVIDGKIKTKVEASNIKPNDIGTMNILKGTIAENKYGQKGKNGVIEIYTNDENLTQKNKQSIILNSKNTDNPRPEPVYVINEKIVTKEEFKKLKPQNIKNVSVLNSEQAINKHGDKGQNGVIEITTKKENDDEELLYFTTEFCKINLQVKPKVTAYAKNKGFTFKIMNVEDSENKELFKKLNIVKFPAAVIMKDNNVIKVLKQDDLKKLK